jgi:uncharacterized membrane protein YdjX (TVP38/TMEM64 family)
MSNTKNTRNKKNIPWKLIVLVLAVAALFVAARFLPVEQWIEKTRGWIDSLGAWGPAAFIAIYALAAAALVPGSPMTVAAGALFGAMGIVYTVVGATLGACLGFLIARYAARGQLERYFQGTEKFERVDTMIERRGFLAVAILRLTPIFPFNLLNYALGLTKIGFVTYTVATFLFITPATAVFVLGADALLKGLKSGEIPWIIIGGALAALVVVAGLGYWAQKKMRAVEKSAQ